MQQLISNGIKTYIVGGYVRDRLLGLVPKDHDFVVVGATPELMLELGFQQVGADFPVFLNPQTNDEFALARTERKSGVGYHGFEYDADPTVTLEDDLYRRDFTINAMAREVLGWNDQGHAKLNDEVIDPFGGREDLQRGAIRHVSEHVRDDPLRVIRAARFAARYHFFITQDTVSILKQVSASGELDHLPAERLWVEFEKAVVRDNFGTFIHYLDALGVVQNRLAMTFDPKANWFLSFREDIRRDLLMPDLMALQFSHQPSIDNIHALVDAIKIPNDVARLMYHTWMFINVQVKHDLVKDPHVVQEWFHQLKVHQDLGLFFSIIRLGRILGADRETLDLLLKAAEEWNKIKAKTLLTPNELSGMMGVEIGKAVEEARLNLLREILSKE